MTYHSPRIDSPTVGAQRVAVRERYPQGFGADKVSYLVSDHPFAALRASLGSTSVTYNASTGAAVTQLYKPCPHSGGLRTGEVRYASGALPTDYTYTGQYSNTADFGLMYYRARWYDPSLGRFSQADTIVPLASQGSQAWDRYAYVNNNPLRYSDPSGHCIIICTAIIGAAVGAISGAVGYTIANHNANFNGGEFAAAVVGGAIAGGLIGSGMGILASGATITAAATATSMISAGTATGISEATYIVQNPGEFETVPFVAEAAIAGTTAYLTANPTMSPLTKVSYEVVGAELTYLITANDPTWGGATGVGVGALVGSGLDVGLDWAYKDTFRASTALADKYFHGTGTSPMVVEVADRARLRAAIGDTLYGAFSGLITGAINSYAQHLGEENLR